MRSETKEENGPGEGRLGPGVKEGVRSKVEEAGI